MNIQQETYRASFVRGIVNGQTLTRILLDCGNFFGNIVSQEYAKMMKLNIIPNTGTTVGTADKQGKIKILGKADTPLKVQLENLDITYHITVWVAEGFSHPLNLSRNCLGRMKAKLDFFKNTLEVIGKIGKCPLISYHTSLVNGRITDTRFTKMIKRFKEESNKITNTKERNIYTTTSVTLPANTINFISTQVEDLPETRQILVEPEFLRNTKSRQSEALVAKGIYTVENGRARIAVLNPHPRPVKIRANACLGTITEQFQVKYNPTNVLDIGINLVEKQDTQGEEADIQKKRNWIIEQLKLDENSIMTTHPEIKEDVIKIFLDNYGALAQSKYDYGTTSLVKFKIDLVPGAVPIKQKVKLLNPNQLEDLRQQIEAWKQGDVIEEAVSPWGFRLVPVQKKDNSTRWCVDYRRLNEMTIKDSYPLTSITGNIEKLSGAKFFTTLDSCGAYHNIQIEPESRDFTTFVSPLGSYRFKKLPFGVSNAPSCYSRLVDIILSKIPPTFALGYLDDIIIYSRTLTEHVDHLRAVVELHTEAGLKLNLKKCEVLKSKVQYLGHIVSAAGIGMVEEYVTRITNWPTPTNTKDIRTFMGFISYYRQFFPDFSKITYHINELRSESKKFEWTKKCQEEFENIKSRFTKAPLRAYPDWESPNPFIVTTDFSSQAVAAILSQVQDGQERFIAAAGRKLHRHESNYPSLKGELLAFIIATNHWEHILKYRPFILVTDAASLKYLHSLKNPRGIYYRWMNQVAEYNFTVQHRSGRLNKNADSLSRTNHLPEPTLEEIEEIEKEVACIDVESKADRNLKRTIYQMKEEICDKRLYQLAEEDTTTNTEDSRDQEDILEAITWADLQIAQEHDEHLKEVLVWVKRGEPPTKQELRGKTTEVKQYAGIFNALKLEDGVLIMKYILNSRVTEVERVCIPENLQKAVWKLAHEDPTAGHRGIMATALRMKNRVFFPQLYPKIKNWIQHCPACVRKVNKVRDTKSIHISGSSSSPMEKVAVDLVGPLLVTSGGNKYILTLEDLFTRWTEAIPLPNKESGTVCRAIIDHFISRHGVMNQIHSDQGSEWSNKIWNELMAMLRIKATMTPAYNPRSNPVERFHRTIESILRTSSYLSKDDWQERLYIALLAYRTSVHTATGVTPFYALYGREAILPLDLIIPYPESRREIYNNININLQQHLEQIYQLMRKNQQLQIKRISQRYTGQPDKLDQQLQIGDKVWYFTPRQIVGQVQRKMSTSWTGPWIIIERIAPLLFKIQPEGRDKPTTITTIDRLRKYRLDYTDIRHKFCQDELEEELDEYAEIPYDVTDEITQEQIREENMEPLPLATSPTLPIAENIPEEAESTMLEKEDRATLTDEIENTVETTEMSTKRPRSPEEEELFGEPSHKQLHLDFKRRLEDSSYPVAKRQEMSSSSVPNLPQITKDETTALSTSVSDDTIVYPEDMISKEEDEPKTTLEEEKKIPTRTMPPRTARTRAKASIDTDIFKRISKGKLHVLQNIGEYRCQGEKKIKLKIQLLPGASIPRSHSDGAAGLDLRANKDVVLKPGELQVVPTGIRIEFPKHVWAKIEGRSSLAIKKIFPIGGVIDADFRGEIKVLLVNLSTQKVQFLSGERIAQLILFKIVAATFSPAETLNETRRGWQWAGSTNLLY